MTELWSLQCIAKRLPVRFGTVMLGMALWLAAGRGVALAQDLAIQPIASPSTYYGSLDASASCTQPYQTVGHEPVAPGAYPLFLYFIGTIHPGGVGVPDPAADEVVKAMAARGFVAVQVEYDNGWEIYPQQLHHKVACMFDPARSDSLVGVLCGRSNVDCNRGIATWGHSQGAAVALMAKAYDARVRATLGIGIGEGLSAAWTRALLPNDRVRLIAGDTDLVTALVLDTIIVPLPEMMSRMSGQRCAASPCLIGPNGSGWLLVPSADLRDKVADHCWFNRWGGCTNTLYNDPAWLSGTAQYALPTSADWVRTTTALGPPPSRVTVADFARYPVGAVSGSYPWGTIDWGATSNFRAVAGLAGPTEPAPEILDPRHVTIGTSASPATGTFSLHGRHGRTLAGLLVYNSDSAPVAVTTGITYADGTPTTRRTDSVAARSWALIAPNAERAAAVDLTSGNGNRLKIAAIAIGAAPN